MKANTRTLLDQVVAALRRLGWLPTDTADLLDTTDGYSTRPGKEREAKEQARARGFDVLEADSNELFIDLDGEKELNVAVLAELHEHLGEYEVATWQSKSGGAHVVLIFPGRKFTHAEATALEAALGSDPVRAAINIVRMRKGVKNPRLLFRPPQKAGAEGSEYLDHADNMVGHVECALDHFGFDRNLGKAPDSGTAPVPASA